RRKLVPDSRNSALQIAAVGKLLAGQPVITPPAEAMFELLPAQARLSEEQAAFLAKRLATLRPAVLEARKLMDMPEGRAPIKYSDDFISTLVPHVQTAREVAELLRWDAVWRLHAGDADGAIES